MCKDCGCSQPSEPNDALHTHDHAHDHGHAHSHEHSHHHHDHGDGSAAHDHPPHATKGRKLSVERSLLEANDHQAWHNREHFRTSGVFALNLMSSPGAGKTRLLERTLDDLGSKLKMAVVVGDLQTDNDARRLQDRGAPVIPITTGTMCHLEAGMVHKACHQLDLHSLDVLFIENVGNLVCPASFDLGEASRVVLMSVTEGEDKPFKYPPMFKLADAVLLTKTDMAEAADFNVELAAGNIRNVAPQAELFQLSARTRDGLEAWYEFILRGVAEQKHTTAAHHATTH